MVFSKRKVSFAAIVKLAAILLVSLVVSSCQGGIDSVFPKAERPVPAKLLQKMKAKGMPVNAPILLRIYKSENTLEVWKQKDTGRFALLETYEICKWSGKLGPKFKEGDRQAPEGFYRVGKAQLNPNSDYHLSFNIGYPNTYDRSHGRTGTHLMVHGACSSAGCYSMNDEQVEEIYSLARDALKGGQEAFQVQAYPFRMTAANLAKHASSEYFEFWKMLKEGYDHFELTNYPPKVDICERRYVFNRVEEEGSKFSASSACPPLTMPRKLLASYSELLSKEKIEFKKAIQREYAKAKREGSALANIDVETLSIVAKGNEILPPATPEAAPVKPEPAVEPAIADASPQTPSSSQEVQANEDVQTASSPTETASSTALTAIPTPSPVQPSPNGLPVASDTGPNVPSVVEVENNSEGAANASVQQAGDPAAVLPTGPAVIPVPQPAQRETAAAAEPAKKTPWWQRKKPEPQS